MANSWSSPSNLLLLQPSPDQYWQQLHPFSSSWITLFLLHLTSNLSGNPINTSFKISPESDLLNTTSHLLPLWFELPEWLQQAHHWHPCFPSCHSTVYSQHNSLSGVTKTQAMSHLSSAQSPTPVPISYRENPSPHHGQQDPIYLLALTTTLTSSPHTPRLALWMSYTGLFAVPLTCQAHSCLVAFAVAVPLLESTSIRYQVS